MNDYLFCDTYYGSYRTRTFCDIFPSFEEFEAEYNDSPLTIAFSKNGTTGLTLAQFYLMMYAHYGNSHIAYSDEYQFKYYMYSIMYQYAPAVIKKREIQDKLRAMTEEEIVVGGKAIYNHAYNPSTAPSTSTLEELTTINDQNTTNYRKSLLEGYANLLALLEDDVVDEFIHKFRRLFIKVLAPDTPLLYETFIMEDN